MKAWTDITFDLEGGERLLVTTHEETTMQVSLHAPGYLSDMDGQGFDIRFTTAHIPVLTELLEALQKLKTLENSIQAALVAEDLAA